MFGNTLLLCGAGQGNNGPVISDIKWEAESGGCIEGDLWEPETMYCWIKISELKSSYVLIQWHYSTEDASKAKTVKCNIGASTLKDDYRRIGDLPSCGWPGTRLFRMCWADASYNQISDWSDWKSFSP